MLSFFFLLSPPMVALANVDKEAAEADEPEYEESVVEETTDKQPFSIEGNGQILDHAEDDDTKAAFDHLSRNNTRGLTTERHIYKALCPTLELDNGKVQSVTIQPLELCFDLEGPMKGLPRPAEEQVSREIFDRLIELSKPYGTKLAYENGQIRVNL